MQMAKISQKSISRTVNHASHPYNSCNFMASNIHHVSQKNCGYREMKCVQNGTKIQFGNMNLFVYG
jgi:hypothetical protein